MNRTARVTLRPWRPDDAAALVPLANDRDVWINLRDRFPHPYTERDANAWIAYNTRREGPPLHLAVEHDGLLVGACGLEPRDDVYRRTAEIGYWVGRAHWGKGIATEAVRLLTEHAFRSFRLERLQASVFAWNPASARVLEKNDYVFEGRLRRAVVKAERVGDVLLYARVRGSQPSKSGDSVASTTAP